jgi:hypothetical protein
MLNQLVATVEQVMTTFPKIFSNMGSTTVLELLNRYPSPHSLVSAPSDDGITLIRNYSRRGADYAQKKYKRILHCVEDAAVTGILTGNYGRSQKRKQPILRMRLCAKSFTWLPLTLPRNGLCPSEIGQTVFLN